MFGSVSELFRNCCPDRRGPSAEAKEEHPESSIDARISTLKDIVKKLSEELKLPSDSEIDLKVARAEFAVEPLSMSIQHSKTILIPKCWLEDISEWLPEGFELRREGERFKDFLARATFAIQEKMQTRKPTDCQIEFILRSLKKPEKAQSLIKFQLANQLCTLQNISSIKTRGSINSLFKALLFIVILSSLGVNPEAAMLMGMAAFVGGSYFQRRSIVDDSSIEAHSQVLAQYPELEQAKLKYQSLINSFYAESFYVDPYYGKTDDKEVELPESNHAEDESEPSEHENAIKEARGEIHDEPAYHVQEPEEQEEPVDKGESVNNEDDDTTDWEVLEVAGH